MYMKEPVMISKLLVKETLDEHGKYNNGGTVGLLQLNLWGGKSARYY